jgi:hypothetical protein
MLFSLTIMGTLVFGSTNAFAKVIVMPLKPSMPPNLKNTSTINQLELGKLINLKSTNISSIAPGNIKSIDLSSIPVTQINLKNTNRNDTQVQMLKATEKQQPLDILKETQQMVQAISAAQQQAIARGSFKVDR